jgi:TonB family protein
MPFCSANWDWFDKLILSIQRRIMRGLWRIVLFVAATASFASGQQTTTSAPPQLADNQPERAKVYSVGPGVTAPQLLSTSPVQIDSGKCKKKVESKVIFSVLVDSLGRPRNLMFLQPLGNELDKFALQVASADRFASGTQNGVPVVVGQTLEVSLQACVEQTKDDAGNKSMLYRLRAQPSQTFRPLADSPEGAVLAPKDWSWGNSKVSAPETERVGGSVKAPVLLKSVEAHFTNAARKARLEGSCLISIVVDRNGMPQDIRITKSLDDGLDQNAINAVAQYRFKPAMIDGEPVPAVMNVVIEFRLY